MLYIISAYKRFMVNFWIVRKTCIIRANKFLILLKLVSHLQTKYLNRYRQKETQ